jgi:hypothetical protein
MREFTLPARVVATHIPGRVIYTVLDAEGMKHSEKTVEWDASPEAHKAALQQLREVQDRITR